MSVGQENVVEQGRHYQLIRRYVRAVICHRLWGLCLSLSAGYIPPIIRRALRRIIIRRGIVLSAGMLLAVYVKSPLSLSGVVTLLILMAFNTFLPCPHFSSAEPV